jgi:hypothetical protein
LKIENKITPEFASVLIKDLGYTVNTNIINNFWRIYNNPKGIVRLTEEDSLAIRSEIDSIYRLAPPDEKGILKFNYSSNYVSQYYRYKYDLLDANERDELLQRHFTFGNYIHLLLASDDIQCPYLGNYFYY